MTWNRWLLGSGATGLALLTLGACTNSSTLARAPTTTAGVTLATESSPGGRIVTTATGQTLYEFAQDTPGHSACVSSICTFVWPPDIVQGSPTVGAGLKASLVGTIRRPGGTLQITYGGHPLYFYSNDHLPGTILGQGVSQSGGLWYVVSPSGQPIITSFTVNQ